MPKTTEELYKELIEKGNSAQQKANDILTQIDNRPAFQYDARTDPLYQSYKDQYVHQGKRAMEDTMGQAAGLTGGYGSTYSQSVGNQAYNEYLTKLNSQIPVLAQQARAAYDAEGQRMMDRYNLALNEANTAYAQGRDALGDMRYDQEYADKIAYQDWQKQQQQQQWDYEVAQKSKAQAYEMAMQMISTGQTPANDLLSQAGISSDYARAMAAYYKQQAALSGSSGGGRSYSSGSGSRGRSRSSGSNGKGGGSSSGNGTNGEPKGGGKTSFEASAIGSTDLDRYARMYGSAASSSKDPQSVFDKLLALYTQKYGSQSNARSKGYYDQWAAGLDEWWRSVRQRAVDAGYIRGYKNFGGGL